MNDIKHFTKIADLGPKGVAEVIERAIALKKELGSLILQDRLLGMVFFNPSLRTRTSFEAAMLRGGGHSIVLDIGGPSVWKLEEREGVVMDGDRAEHVREAVPVLARYVDALAVRTFAGLTDPDEDERDPVMSAFREYSTVPVVNMESGREHPNQGLGDLMTLKERFGETKKLKVTLTWAPHMKPLPQAVPASFLLTAAAAGCEVTVTHPEGFDLHPSVVAQAEGYAAETGGAVRFTTDQQEAFDGAAAVYTKSWAPIGTIQNRDAMIAAIQKHRDWLVTGKKLAAAGDPIFLHCLPIRRNLVASDDVLDGPWSAVVDEAENRLHVQRAILERLIGA